MSPGVPPKKDSLSPKQAAFLAAFAETGSVKLAAATAKVSRRSHSRWMDDDAYAQAFSEASEEAADTLEAEARRRAVQGVEKPVWHKGERVGTVRQYSDTLLIFLMKAAMPAKYGDRVTVDEHQRGQTKILVIPDNGRGPLPPNPLATDQLPAEPKP